MKLGLLTDIHESNDYLERALHQFEVERVDQIIIVGDLYRTGTEIARTVELLAGAGATGIWGNHDYGLCVDPSESVRQKHAGPVLDFMSTLEPRLEVEGCLFTHVEPWLNSEDISDLWFIGGPPDCSDDAERIQRIFKAVPNRLMFTGHYHKWLLVGEDEVQDWDGRSVITLDSGRFMTVVGAVCEGRFAVFDTENSLLTPFNLM